MRCRLAFLLSVVAAHATQAQAVLSGVVRDSIYAGANVPGPFQRPNELGGAILIWRRS